MFIKESGSFGKCIQKINLDNSNELIVYTKNETFSDRYKRNIYYKSINKIY